MFVRFLKARTIFRRTDVRYRIVSLVALLVASIAALAFLDPLPQSLAYHGFADTRLWLNIPNFGDVASNLPYAFLGVYGFWRVLGPTHQRLVPNPVDCWPYALFFIGVALVGFGSSYYHAAPDNTRLVWDRLPMTVAFMSLFSAFIADRIDQRIGVKRLLPILIAVGIGSVAYWNWTESLGRGDLRFYFLVQFYPVVALPLLCWLFPPGRYTNDRSLAWLIAWYMVAKVLEVFDSQVFNILGGAVSGHSLKHLTSSVAVIVVIHMLSKSRRRQQRQP